MYALVSRLDVIDVIRPVFATNRIELRYTELYEKKKKKKKNHFLLLSEQKYNGYYVWLYIKINKYKQIDRENAPIQYTMDPTIVVIIF